MRQNIIFKCYDNDIDLSMFLDNIVYLGDSRIDTSHIYKTSNNLMFSNYVIDILNTKNKSNLELILRRKKIEKILKNHKIVLSLHYEFLNFWYDNFDDLTIMVPKDDLRA